MGKLITICKLDDVLPNQGRAFEVDGRRIAVFNVEGKFYAIDDACSHAGGSLAEGEILNTSVSCPLHGAKFDLETGMAMSAPAFEAVNIYTVISEGDELKIELNG